MSRSHSLGASALALAIAFTSINPQPGNAQAGPFEELPTVEVEAAAGQGGSLPCRRSPNSASKSIKRLARSASSMPTRRRCKPATWRICARLEGCARRLRREPLWPGGPLVDSRIGSNPLFSSSRLQDGIPVSLADGSGDFDEIDPLYFRSIEIFKGGNALAFGTSTLGGAINFISPTAYTALATDLIRIDDGSFGSIRGQVQVSRVLGNFDFLINDTFTHSDGYRAHSTSDFDQINGNIRYRFAPWAETRFYFGAYDAQQKIPGQLTLNDALNNPTLASVSAAFPGFGGNQARNTFDERIANKTTVLTDWGRLDLDSWFIHNTLYHPIFLVLDQDGYTLGIEPRFSSKMDLGGFRNDLIVGARVLAAVKPTTASSISMVTKPCKS